MEPPLEGYYLPALGIALFSLIPYILVAGGDFLYRTQTAADLGVQPGALSIIAGLGIAGYAFGALFGGDIANRYSHRNLLLITEMVLITGWILAAAAPGIIVYGTGFILSGFTTGMLLVIALPPAIRQFPPERVPLTAAFINVAFFGAIAAGPLLGGLINETHSWRLYYASLAAVGFVILALIVISIAHTEPSNPNMRIDYTGLALGFGATVLPFWASGELPSAGFSSYLFMVPMAVGLACLIALLLVEYGKKEPLAPVKMLWSTIPLTGIVIAMMGGGAFVTFVELTSEYLHQAYSLSALATGLTFWPQVLGAVVAAVIMGLLYTTRYMPLLALAGMGMLIAGGVLLAMLNAPSSNTQLLAAIGLLGLGAGATVSPGLFIAGWSAQSSLLARIFALVELVRSIADFILAPVMTEVAHVISGGKLTAAGIQAAMWLTLWITAAITAFAGALYLLGGAPLPKPNLKAWISENKPAIPSFPLLQLLRRQR